MDGETGNVRVTYERRLDRDLCQQIADILRDCDDDFVPPLSARHSTHQTCFQGDEPDASGPTAYLAELCRQPFVLATLDDRVVGFLSLIPHPNLGHIGLDGDVLTYPPCA